MKYKEGQGEESPWNSSQAAKDVDQMRVVLNRSPRKILYEFRLKAFNPLLDGEREQGLIGRRSLNIDEKNLQELFAKDLVLSPECLSGICFFSPTLEPVCRCSMGGLRRLVTVALRIIDNIAL